MWTWSSADETATIFEGLTVRPGRHEGQVLITLKTQLVYDERGRDYA